MKSEFSLIPRACCVVMLLVLWLPSAAVNAQEVNGVSIEQLRAELAKRDAVIVELLNRVRALEDGRVDDGAGTLRGAGREEPPSQLVADTEEAARAPSEDAVDIDELLAERALERGLVQEGARLLPPGQIEIAPGFAIAHDEGMFPTALMVGDDSVVGEVARTFDVYETSANLKFGLPRDFQLDVALPYRVVDQEVETGIDGAVHSAANESGSGFGDIAIGMAKVLATEGSRRPNIIGQLVWLTGSGEARDGDVYLGGGNSGLAARLSANWRRDPVVFLISGGYTYYDEEGPIQLGDSYDYSLGMGLAVSPETALMFSLDQTSVSELMRDGVGLPGTDRLSSTLSLSASTILGRKLFLRANAGLGLTDDAPDFRFGVSVSSRFNRR